MSLNDLLDFPRRILSIPLPSYVLPPSYRCKCKGVEGGWWVQEHLYSDEGITIIMAEYLGIRHSVIFIERSERKILQKIAAS